MFSLSSYAYSTLMNMPSCCSSVAMSKDGGSTAPGRRAANHRHPCSLIGRFVAPLARGQVEQARVGAGPGDLKDHRPAADQRPSKAPESRETPSPSPASRP